MSEIRVGDIVLMKGFKRVARSAVVEATFTHQRVKGAYDVFLWLGGVKEDETSTFSPESVLESMGWRFVGDDASRSSLSGTAEENK